MFIPVGNETQYIEVIDKDTDGVEGRKRIMGVRVSLFKFDFKYLFLLIPW